MKTKTKSLALAPMRPVALLGLMMIAVLVLTACQPERRADRIAFDGQFFRTTAKKLDKERLNFEVTVRPVSASLEGARQAGAHEATRYCIGNFGTSEIVWINGPDGEGGSLRVSGDRLELTGTCAAL